MRATRPRNNTPCPVLGTVRLFVERGLELAHQAEQLVLFVAGEIAEHLPDASLEEKLDAAVHLRPGLGEADADYAPVIRVGEALGIVQLDQRIDGAGGRAERDV